MNITKYNRNNWGKLVENECEIKDSIEKLIKLNEEYYSNEPYNINNGYGIHINIFSELNEFVEYIVEYHLFELIVEKVEILECKRRWCCLTYIVSNDNCIVNYIRLTNKENK